MKVLQRILNPSDNSNVMRSMAHAIAICMIFLLPEMIFNFTSPHGAPGIRWGMYGKAVGYIIVFYVNYLWLVPRYLITRRSPGLLIGANILLVLAVMVFILLWDTYFRPFDMGRRPEANKCYSEQIWMWRSLNFLVRDFVMCILSASLAAALRLGGMWLRYRARLQREALERRQAELEALRAQLNPHFLFNSINTVYALIDIDTARAQEALHNLSDILRYVLYQSYKDVDLEHAVAVVAKYVQLMNMRLSAPLHLTLHTDIDANPHLTLAPMMLLTIAENVFKHAVVGAVRPVMEIRAQADGTFTCHTVNATDNPATSNNPGGIGLRNLRRRLYLIYGTRATLGATVADNIFTTNLKILPPQ